MYLKPATGLYLIHCPTYTVFQKLTGVCADRFLDVREKRRPWPRTTSDVSHSCVSEWFLICFALSTLEDLRIFINVVSLFIFGNFFSKFFYLKPIVFIPKQDNFSFEWSQSALSTGFCFVDFQCLCLYYRRVFSSLWDILQMLKSKHSVFPNKPITWHEWKNTWSAGQRHLTHKRQKALSYSIVSHFMQLSKHVFVWVLTFRCFYVIHSSVTSVSTEAPLLGLAIFVY